MLYQYKLIKKYLQHLTLFLMFLVVSQQACRRGYTDLENSLAYLSKRVAPSGIPNVGNTCYMNSVLQVIAAVYKDNVRDESLKRLVDQINKCEPIEREDIDAFCTVIMEKQEGMVNDKGKKLVPNPFNVKGRSQQDAQEFFTLLATIKMVVPSSCPIFVREVIKVKVDSDSQELLLYKERPPEERGLFQFTIPIQKEGGLNEGGMLNAMINNSIHEIVHDDKRRVDFEDYTPCKLDICPGCTLEQELPVVVTGAFDRNSEVGVPNWTTKEVMKNFPNKFAIALRRNGGWIGGGGGNGHADKDDSEIKETEKINIKGDRDNSCDYNLCAFIVQRGSMDFGHYVAYVQKAGRWYLADDNTVIPQTTATAIKASEKAYLFFYEKASAAPAG